MSNLTPFFRCSGKSDPEDHNLAANLEGVRLFDESEGVYCTSTVEVDKSEVHVILEGLSVPEGADIRVFRTIVMQLAQLLADTSLRRFPTRKAGTILFVFPLFVTKLSLSAN